MEQHIIDEIKAKETLKNKEYVVLSREDHDGKEQEMLFASPSSQEISMFLDNTANGVSNSIARKAFEALIMQCVRYPSKEETKALLERKPYFMIYVVTELQKLAGSQEKVFVKKV